MKGRQRSYVKVNNSLTLVCLYLVVFHSDE